MSGQYGANSGDRSFDCLWSAPTSLNRMGGMGILLGNNKA